jgi:hypothetical protein
MEFEVSQDARWTSNRISEFAGQQFGFLVAVA